MVGLVNADNVGSLLSVVGNLPLMPISISRIDRIRRGMETVRCKSQGMQGADSLGAR